MTLQFLIKNISFDMTREILKRLDIPQIRILCRGNEKVCTNLFWLNLYQDKYGLDLDKVLEGAIEQNHPEMVAYLIKNLIDPSKHNQTAIIDAASKGYAEVVKVLLTDARVDPSVQNNRPLLSAINHPDDLTGAIGPVNYLEVVKLLLDHPKVKPSVPNNLPIILASGRGNLDMVKLLLSYKSVDPRVKSNLALTRAAGYGYIEIVKMLLPRSNPRNLHEALQSAIERGHIDIVKILISKATLHNLQLALHTASSHGHSELVKLFLNDKRVNPNFFSGAAIRGAAIYGHFDVVKILLMDPRVDPSNGENEALKIALKKNYFDIVELLFNNNLVKNKLSPSELEDIKAKIEKERKLRS